MKVKTYKYFVIVILLAVVSSCSSNKNAENYIWVVRNSYTDSTLKLNKEGQYNARRLDTLLNKYEINELYAFRDIPCVQTLTPLSKSLGVKINALDEVSFNKLLNNLNGKNAVFCLSRNQIIPFIKRFNVKTTIDSISRDDYEYLFKLIIPSDTPKKSRVEIRYF
jgi:hypothetical protein